MENSAEFYYERLKKEENPGVILAAFYCSLYDTKVTRSEIIMFNKLVKTYSRFIVFFSILDVTGSYSERPEKPYPLFSAICKRRFELTHLDTTLQARESLEKYLSNIDEEIKSNHKKKLKIPSSEGLE